MRQVFEHLGGHLGVDLALAAEADGTDTVIHPAGSVEQQGEEIIFRVFQRAGLERTGLIEIAGFRVSRDVERVKLVAAREAPGIRDGDPARLRKGHKNKQQIK